MEIVITYYLLGFGGVSETRIAFCKSPPLLKVRRGEY
jgi:hypothetical protein